VAPPIVVVRYVVLAVVGLAVAGAAAAMAVQRRLVNPFGAPARAVRRLTDPMLVPIEGRLRRAGHNPQSAPWWLIGIALMAGILAISTAEWLLAIAMSVRAAQGQGSRLLLALAVDLAFNALKIALIVRVVGSWFGATRWTPWMRPFHAATEWMLAPLRRVLPAMGPLDISPLVAWFALELVRTWVVGAL